MGIKRFKKYVRKSPPYKETHQTATRKSKNTQTLQLKNQSNELNFVFYKYNRICHPSASNRFKWQDKKILKCQINVYLKTNEDTKRVKTKYVPVRRNQNEDRKTEGKKGLYKKQQIHIIKAQSSDKRLKIILWRKTKMNTRIMRIRIKE